MGRRAGGAGGAGGESSFSQFSSSSDGEVSHFLNAYLSVSSCITADQSARHCINPTTLVRVDGRNGDFFL